MRQFMPLTDGRPLRTALALCLGLGLWLIAGCNRVPQEEIATPEDETVEEARPLRLVSLAPALTRMLVDLDLGDLIVGVTDPDAAAPPQARVVSGVEGINNEALLALQPTHILTMVGARGVPEELSRAAEMQKAELIAYPYPEHVNDLLAILYQEQEMVRASRPGEMVSLGTRFGVASKAYQLKLRILFQLGEIGRITQQDGVEPVSVLMVFGVDPVLASGPDTVLDSLLRTVNGRNAAWDATVSAPQFDREKLLAAQPQAILLLMPGAPPLQPLDQDPRLAAFHGLDIPAVKTGRIALLNDPYILLPSTTVAETAARMAKALHPNLAEPIDRAMAAALEDPALAPGLDLNRLAEDLEPQRDAGLMETLESPADLDDPAEPATLEPDGEPDLDLLPAIP